MVSLKRDPNPGVTPADGSIIKTDQHNEILDRIGTDGSGNPITANRAVATNASGFLVASAATASELGYLSGALSNIQTQLDSKASTSHQSSHQSGGSDALSGNLDAVARVTLRRNGGADVGSRRRLNLIEGANITLTVADDSINEEVDVTIAASGGGTNHNILSATHSDSVAATVVQGDLVKGNATPAWERLPRGTADQFLQATSADILWRTLGGDATLSGGTMTISNDVVTYAKMQNISATSRFLGRITAGAGDPEELTGTQATTLLDVFTSALKGLAPASGGGTTNFLRADGTWAAPPGGSGASLTRIAGSSGAAGADITWQNLTANSADVTTTTLSSSIMTTTGVGAGTWKFKYTLIYQTAATTTGIAFGINHTGTVTLFKPLGWHATTGTTGATSIGDSNTTGTGTSSQLVEGKSNVTLNAIIGAASAGVDTANTNIIFILEGIIVVTASGDLELKIASEVSGSAVRVMADSCLELHKIE